jgi:hypothetical protein
VPVVALDCLHFDYYEYYFYSTPRKQKGMTIIKYPLYRFFVRDEDAFRFVAVKDKKRKPRADTI